MLETNEGCFFSLELYKDVSLEWQITIYLAKAVDIENEKKKKVIDFICFETQNKYCFTNLFKT